jgi:MFS family permease
MLNVLFTKHYPTVYTSSVKTQVSNALLVGEILGQVVIGITCDYLGRKTAIVLTTLMVVVGGILATASHGVTTLGMFWMLTIARGIVGFGAGGKYSGNVARCSYCTIAVC